jgi:hypothetical protein
LEWAVQEKKKLEKLNEDVKLEYEPKNDKALRELQLGQEVQRQEQQFYHQQMVQQQQQFYHHLQMQQLRQQQLYQQIAQLSQHPLSEIGLGAALPPLGLPLGLLPLPMPPSFPSLVSSPALFRAPPLGQPPFPLNQSSLLSPSSLFCAPFSSPLPITQEAFSVEEVEPPVLETDAEEEQIRAVRSGTSPPTIEVAVRSMFRGNDPPGQPPLLYMKHKYDNNQLFGAQKKGTAKHRGGQPTRWKTRTCDHICVFFSSLPTTFTQTFTQAHTRTRACIDEKICRIWLFVLDDLECKRGGESSDILEQEAIQVLEEFVRWGKQKYREVQVKSGKRFKSEHINLNSDGSVVGKWLETFIKYHELGAVIIEKPTLEKRYDILAKRFDFPLSATVQVKSQKETKHDGV